MFDIYPHDIVDPTSAVKTLEPIFIFLCCLRSLKKSVHERSFGFGVVVVVVDVDVVWNRDDDVWKEREITEVDLLIVDWRPNLSIVGGDNW